MSASIELMLYCDLIEHLPQEALDMLVYMTRKEDYNFQYSLDHSFFHEDTQHYWKILLQSPKPAPNNYDLNYSELEKCIWNDRLYTLSYRSKIDTVHGFLSFYFPFLKWLAPYAYPKTGFQGFIQRTDNKGDYPTFIFFNEGKVCFGEVGKVVVEITDQNIRNFI